MCRVQNRTVTLDVLVDSTTGGVEAALSRGRSKLAALAEPPAASVPAGPVASEAMARRGAAKARMAWLDAPR